MQLVPLFLMLPVLVVAAATDLRGLRIPNKLVLISLAVFVLTCPLLPFSEIAARLLVALVVFGVGFAMFAFRLIGGGDVKFLSALMLFIPANSLPMFGIAFSISMLVSISLLVAARTVLGRGGAGLEGLHANGRLPMGIPIAMAGIAHLFVMALAG